MPLRFRWNDAVVEARAGDSIAAALTAAGHRVLGTGRDGRPRSQFCGMGICQDCLVTVDGRTAQRSCMTTVRDGMVVAAHDDGRSMPSPDLGTGASERPPDSEVDLAVLGAGPAGLNAALAAAAAGLAVVVVDERGEAGGQYFKPRAEGFRGAFAEDAQHQRGSALRDRVAAAAIEVWSGETVWYARRDERGGFDLRTHAGSSIGRIIARAVIVGTGAYELPPLVQGWTLPGVMTIGAAQTLARRYGVVPGGKIVIAGHGPLALQLAAEITRLGGRVIAVADRARLHGVRALARAAVASPDLVRDGAGYALELIKRRIPFLRGWELLAVEGKDAAESAVLGRLADARRLVVAADTVCVGEGFSPQAEITRLLGAPVELDPDRGIALPVRDKTGATAVPGLWIVGDAGAMGGARMAEAQGTLAGLAAADHLGREAGDPRPARKRLARAARFQRALWRLYAAPPRTAPDPATVVCRCEEVTALAVREAITGGARDVGAIKRKTRLGMGRCQGRYCVPAALAQLGAQGVPAGTDALMTPQVPARPVPVAALAREQAEWSGHRESRPSARPAAPSAEPLRRARADLAIIGAGITGIAAAYFAAKAGAEVVVLDRGRINAEASGGNAGSLHLQLLSWDFGGKAVGGGGLQLRTLPLQKESIALWGALQSELGADFEMEITGGLMVAENRDQIRFLEAKADAERGMGIDTEVIDAGRIREIAPCISEQMVAAAWCAGEGKINPMAASMAIADAARRHGAVFEELAPVTGLAAEGDRYSLITGRGAFEARRVVIAAGGWAAEIGAMLGCQIPVRGAPLQMLVTEPAAPFLPCLVAHADRHLTMKQTAAGTVLIGGAWTAETSPSGQPMVLPDSIEGNAWIAARTVPSIGGLRLIRSWAAMNIDIDGAPLLGALPGHPGVVIAATANGYTLGPMMGREAAEIALHGRARDDLGVFDFRRFR